MIFAFLRAEVDSELFGPAVLQYARLRGWDRSLIDRGDPWAVTENRARREILGDVRGYGRNALLFTNFPEDAQWYRTTLSVERLRRARYAAWPDWVALTNRTLVVADGASRVYDPATPAAIRDHVLGIVDALQRGSSPAELILVGGPDLDELVVLEGHKRATAYVIALENQDELEVILGISPRIEEWAGWSEEAFARAFGLDASSGPI
jgi:hypothetical protein